MSADTRSMSIWLPQLVAPALLIALGIVLLAVDGFIPGNALHEFVHDGRHLAAFPCH